ncbi:MAG: YkgJ family cysteine cluster protein [Myxococcota bacterium]
MTRTPGLIALRPLRHACHACGACCEGWRIRFVDPAEEARIVRHGAALGVERPVEGGALRMVDGRCVFLDERKLCRIHAAFGLSEKPKVCQQFPKRATLAEDGYRVGLDPACVSTAKTWRDGPEIEPLPAMQEERRLDPEIAASERGLIGLTLMPDASVARFVGHLTGDARAVPELPRPFAQRLVKALAVFDLKAQLAGPASGASEDLRARLAHVPPRLMQLDMQRPPAWRGVLPPALDAFALEVLRRHLFLRLGDPLVPPFAQALLVVLGVTACAWADPSPATFPGALSSWARLVRSSSFWGALLPDSEHARWLVTG